MIHVAQALQYFSQLRKVPLIIIKMRRDTQISVPSGDQKQQTDGYAEKALGMLKKAVEAGYFKLPANKDKLEKSPDLNGVRGRAGFAELLGA